jgi:hypothetical protein
MQNRTGNPEDAVQPAGWRAKQAAERKKGEPAGKRGHEAPLGEASLSEEKETNDRQQAAKPLPNRARWQRRLGRRTV